MFKQFRHAIKVLKGEYNPMPMVGMNLKDAKKVLNGKRSDKREDQGNRPDNN